MTGYGRAAVTDGSRTVTVQIRTVNHRFLDFRIRLPQTLLAIEDKVRRTLQTELHRGRVEVTVSVEDHGTESRSVVVDAGLLRGLRDALTKAAAVLGTPETPRLDHVVHIPELIQIREQPTQPDTLWPVVQTALSEALVGVVTMRTDEGQALAADITRRLHTLRQLAHTIAARLPATVQQTNVRLRERVAALLDGATMDADRMATEIALLADRGDVSEELTRIESHIDQMSTLVERGGHLGRKLDFLLQELNREWNTMGSKLTAADVAQQVVTARAEVEKMREQVQNVE